MGESILGIGLSGLAAAQAGLATTGHNISNVNTPGYSREETVQASRAPLFSGSGYVGQGVDVTTVRRVYSDFLAARSVQSQAQASQLNTLQTQLSQLDSLFGDPVSGLAPAIDQFFAGVNALAANPSDVASRQSMLSAGQALTSRFQQLDGQLAALRQGANDRIAGTVGTINTLAGQLASLNRRIMEAGGADAVARPNDLLDQRDNLVAQLNAQVGATSVAQSDGSYNVFLSNGQALVVGQVANVLVAVPDTQDPANLQIGLKTGAGLVRFNSADFSGGALSGAVAFRDQHLAAAQNALGRIAVTLGDAFNAQHRLGQDLAGAPGGAFFGLPAPSVQAALTNSGTAALGVTVADATALTASDYRLQYNGASYTLTRLADGTAQTFASLPQTVDGLTIGITSGAAAAGDSYLILPTRDAARGISMAVKDPTKIAAAAPVRTAATTANAGTGRISAGAVDASYPSAPLAGPVTLTYASGTNLLSGFPASAAVTVTVNGTPTTYPAGTPVPYTPDATISFGGITFAMSGAPANGDTFTVAPNANGIGDSRNAQLLAGLARQNLVGGRTTTFQGAYAQLVSGVGSATQRAGIESDAQARISAQAQAAQSAVSGVNLDEEAANLQRYQQAYQAAGKVMAIAASLFQTVLGIAKP